MLGISCFGFIFFWLLRLKLNSESEGIVEIGVDDDSGLKSVSADEFIACEAISFIWSMNKSLDTQTTYATKKMSVKLCQVWVIDLAYILYSNTY